jgi:DNA-binding NtrC family response regulator
MAGQLASTGRRQARSSGLALDASQVQVDSLVTEALAALPLEDAVASLEQLDAPLRDARDAFERIYFEYHLVREGGNISRVADAVGLERTHLYRKLKHLGIKTSRKNEE